MPSEETAALSRSAIRRQRERKERLKTILGAAETFFASEGFHQTSMERIADEAEVSVGTLYFYFKNKEDLLVNLLDDIGMSLRGMLAQEFRGSTQGFDGLRRASHAFFGGFCREHPEKLTIIFRESVGQSAVVEAYRKKIFEEVIDDIKLALTRLAEARGFEFQSEISLDVMAASVLGTYERLAYHFLIWRTQEGDASLETVAEEAVEFIIGGINNLSRAR